MRFTTLFAALSAAAGIAYAGDGPNAFNGTYTLKENKPVTFGWHNLKGKTASLWITANQDKPKESGLELFDNQDNKGEFTWTPKSDDLKKLNKGKNTLYIYSGHDENSNWGTAYYN